MSDDVNLSTEKDVSPLSLLIRAGWYVHVFEPTSHEQEMDKQALIDDINSIFPPDPQVEYCGVENCLRPKGHEGEHDDIPF